MIHKKDTIITVWKKTGRLDKWGNPSYDVFTAKCRFEDISEIYYGYDGREYRSKSRIGVDFDMEIGDFVAIGDHTSSPNPIDGALEVKDFRKVPNWNYKKFDRWAIV